MKGRGGGGREEIIQSVDQISIIMEGGGGWGVINRIQTPGVPMKGRIGWVDWQTKFCMSEKEESGR